MSEFAYVCRACQRPMSMPAFETCVACGVVLSLTALRRRGRLMAVQLEQPVPGINRIAVSALRCPQCDTPVHDTSGETCATCGFNFLQWADGSIWPALALGAKPVTIDSPFDIDPALQALLRQCETVTSDTCPRCAGVGWRVYDIRLARKPWKPPWFLRFLIKPAPPRPSSACVTCQECERSISVEVAPHDS